MTENRAAGFMWNNDPDSVVLGVYLPDTVNVFAHSKEILDLLSIDTGLVNP